MKYARMVLIGVLAVVALSACSVSVSGGMGVGFLATIVAALLFGTPTRNCVESAHADPVVDAATDGATDAPVDTEAGPCLSIGPCLSAGCNIGDLPTQRAQKGGDGTSDEDVVQRVMRKLPPDVAERVAQRTESKK